MKSKWVVFVLLAGVALSGAGGAAASAVAEAQKSQMLRFGVPVSGIGHMDPHFAAGSQDRALADMVFNGLLRYKPGHAPKLEPDLAVAIPEFNMIAGKQVWTVHLRKGVLFHAGPKNDAYELTADDVIYSLNKSADASSCAYSGEYRGMAFEKVNGHTIRIILDKPLSSILFLPKIANYAGGFIVSKRAIEAMGQEAYDKHPVGTGPFRYTAYEPKKRVLLKAHENYFRGQPLLDGVEIRFLPDIDQREAALRSGVLDVMMGSGEKGWVDRIARVENVVIDSHGVGEVMSLYLNPAVPPLDDIRVRRAIAYALDRDAFLSVSHPQLVGHVYSPVPVQFLPGGLTLSEVTRLDLTYAPDLKKAKALLSETGYPDGFEIDVISSEKRFYRRCYEVMAAQLSRIGIVCRIQFVPHAVMHRMIRTEPRPMVLYAAWRPNADAFLSRFFHSDAIVVTGANPDTNFSNYRNIDRLIEAARLEIDPEKQINLWEQAQIRILHDMVAYPIIYTKQCYVRRRNLDYGHPLSSTMALYPQFTEKTKLVGER